jgi:NADH:ubiquinone oxidoreductase subunit 6 (subunit J)
VYVWAIAVLFVVMMPDIKIVENNKKFSKIFYVTGLVLFGMTFIGESFW